MGEQTNNQPFEHKVVLQGLLVLVVLLAIVAGYYYTAFGLEQRKNNRLTEQLQLLKSNQTPEVKASPTVETNLGE